MHIDDMLNRYDPWIQPIDDQRSTKIYRKKVAMNILQEFIETIGRR
jgi:xanthine dehydrogenase iron-sulfur cluster and FAD-binding subunit A